jgi:membrane protease YdiL (CAAX protease family)
MALDIADQPFSDLLKCSQHYKGLICLKPASSIGNVMKSNEDFTTRHPYAFVALLELVVIVVVLSLGAISGLLAYPVLAVIAILVITKKHWWREIGFIYPRQNSRLLFLFVPVFLPVLWWLVLAPLVGYGVVQIPPVPELSLYFGFILLIGFVEEVYFRGMMLQALRTHGLWHATILTSFLFAGTHALNALYGSSSLYTVLQVGYAFAFGLSFAALVLVTRLIWPLILAHFLTDFSSFLNSAGGLRSTTVTQTDYVITAAAIIVYSTYAIILLRKKTETPQEPEALLHSEPHSNTK